MKGEKITRKRKIDVELAKSTWPAKRKSQFFSNRIPHFVETAELISAISQPEFLLIHIKHRGGEITIESDSLKGLCRTELFQNMLNSYQVTEVNEEEQEEDKQEGVNEEPASSFDEEKVAEEHTAPIALVTKPLKPKRNRTPLGGTSKFRYKRNPVNKSKM